MSYNEEEYLDSLKKADSYHFSIPFEYIKKNYGNDKYDVATTNMEIDVVWDADYHGYQISHYVPDMYLIDPSEGNGDEDEFYSQIVYFEVMDKLDSLGIPPSAIV